MPDEVLSASGGTRLVQRVNQIDETFTAQDATSMSYRTLGIAWMFVLTLLLASQLQADEKPVPSSAPNVKTAKQQDAAQEAPSAQKEITNSIGMKLVLIRAGNFKMGSPETDIHALPKEKPQHRVRIRRPFYLGECEVTRGEYARFVEKTGHLTDAEKHEWGGQGYSGDPKNPFVPNRAYSWREMGFGQTDRHAVVNVSWDDAVAFCNWLNKEEGKQYRLPTEAEWEWACRAGTIDRWSCGDNEATLETHANILDTSIRPKWQGVLGEMKWNDGFPFTAEVGKFKSNPFGLYDMHGNAYEWCSDWYSTTYYANSPMNDPRGPVSGSLRVVRGGCWYLPAKDCRSAVRGGVPQQHRHFNVGFRLALNSDESSGGAGK